jgi:hypothetical protein
VLGRSIHLPKPKSPVGHAKGSLIGKEKEIRNVIYYGRKRKFRRR